MSAQPKPLRLTAPTVSERIEQNVVVRWWEVYARTKALDPRLLFAVPNGAFLAGDKRQRQIQMAKLKQSGLRPGIPDLMLAIPSFSERIGLRIREFLFAGLFIEMKKIGEQATPLQIEVADILRRQGYNVVIAEGSDEAIRAIRAYLGDPMPSRYQTAGKAATGALERATGEAA
jgi:hypothetical protein